MASKTIGGFFGAVVGFMTGNFSMVIASLGSIVQGISGCSSIDEVISKIENDMANARRNLEQSKQKKREILSQKDNASINIDKISGQIKNLFQLKASCFESSQAIKESINECSMNAQDKKVRAEQNGQLLSEKKLQLNEKTEAFHQAANDRETKKASLNGLHSQVTSLEGIVRNHAKDFLSMIPSALKVAAELKNKSKKLDIQINAAVKRKNELGKEISNTKEKTNQNKA